MPVIETRALSKTYGRGVHAVSDLTLDVHQGEVFGFLGQNGAGKTTTIRILLDLVRPTSGEARVFGREARADRDEIRARVGYVPGDLGEAPRETAREHLAYLARIRGLGLQDAVEALAARLDLELDRPIRGLSRGNRQKVALVQALMHEPDLLVLDEPTTGLDPVVQREVHALVNEAKAAGRTVFFSSHVLSEVERLCDRVALLRQGRLVLVDTVEALQRRAVRRVEARFDRVADASWLEGVEGVRRADATGKRLVAEVAGDTGQAVRALVEAGGLVDLTTEAPTLDALFEEAEARA